jgi:FemAB family protein
MSFKSKKKIQSIFKGLIKFELLERSKMDWDGFVDQHETPSFFYNSHYIDFRFECLKGNGILVEDFSFGISLEGKIIGIMPLFQINDSKTTRLEFYDGCIIPVLISKTISLKLKKEIMNHIIKNLISSSKEKVSFFDQLLPSKSLSIWHKVILKYGFNCQILRESFTDLKLSYPEIKSQYRKSYKSLINQGLRLWGVYKYDQKSHKVWDEFKQLHFVSAGRKTRSDKSWDILFEGLKQQLSFFYYCTDNNGAVIGGALVMKNKYEAIYAVAAYDRERFDLPVGHVLQDFIVKDLINSNLFWYRLGRYYEFNDRNQPTEKEVQIGQFKSGFSTDLIANYKFSQ